MQGRCGRAVFGDLLQYSHRRFCAAAPAVPCMRPNRYQALVKHCQYIAGALADLWHCRSNKSYWRVAQRSDQ
jgi:hypothetical protein